MSPEQARGQVVDKRTDIWAFGCVLYELLTGRQVFGGETVTDILGAVLHKDPDWEALPEDTPRAIRRLLRRCLERDPHERLRDIGDARIVIKYVLGEAVEGSTAGVATATPVWWQEPTRLAVVGLMVLVAGVLLGFLLWNLAYDSQPPPPTVTRFSLPLPGDEAIPPQPSLALSPDGTQLVYAAVRDGIMRLYLRSILSLTTALVSELTVKDLLQGASALARGFKTTCELCCISSSKMQRALSYERMSRISGFSGCGPKKSGSSWFTRPGGGRSALITASASLTPERKTRFS